MKPTLLFLIALVLPAVGACAQAGDAQTDDAQAEECALLDLDLTMPPTAGDAARAVLTEAEQRVQAIVARDGVHVVHFWAPWCANSRAELRNGWDDLIAQNASVSFTFVTIWNDGESGAAMLQRHGLDAERVVELTQPDYGPSDDATQRRRSFLGLPVTWIPSTWIFHDNGELAFALNYGEMDMTVLQHLLDAAAADWSHD